MGWHANTDWTMEFISEEARVAARAAMFASMEFDEIEVDTPLDELAELMIRESNENAEGGAEKYDAEKRGMVFDPLAISGYGSGKCYFDEGKAAVLAPYVKGTVDLDGDDGHYRYRFFGDGRWQGFNGTIAYFDDPEETLSIWTLSVITPDFPAPIISVHDSEEACWESLRERFDSEGEADDEPPVAIVAFLENERDLHIAIDTHTIKRGTP